MAKTDDRAVKISEEDLDFSTEFTPEQAMLVRLLEVAIYDSRKQTSLLPYPFGSEGSPVSRVTYDKSQARHDNRRRARRWFRSKSTKPFSFLWVCDQLGIIKEKDIAKIKYFAEVS